MKRVLIIAILILVTGTTNAQSYKRMIKLLEKQEFETLEGLLVKSYDKDSLNPDAFYAHTLLYLNPNYENKSLDSAYSTIRAAIVDFEGVDLKTRDKLGKNGLDKDRMIIKRKEVEKLAFERSLQQETVEDYQYFIDYFTEAEYVAQAIELRNELAFEEARSINTYDSYSYFMSTYPEAKQVKEAKELYDIRLFQERTSKGDLDSFQAFLSEFPDSPYRNQAEKVVFENMTASNRAGDYQRFLREVDHKYYTRKAIDFLYYTENGHSILSRLDVPNPVRDSIELVERISSTFLIPFFEISRYGFMDEKGEIVVEKSIDDIDPSYLCSGLHKDIIHTSGQVIGRNLEEIYSGEIDSVDDLGYGLLEVNDKNSKKIVQKAGHLIKSGNWKEVRILAHSVIAMQLNAGWELISFSGKKFPSNNITEALDFHEFLILERAGKWAILEREKFTNDELPNFQFDEIEIEEDYLLAISGEKIFIMDSLGKRMFKDGFNDVSNRFGKWFLRNGKRYTITYDHSGISYAGFEDIMYNQKYTLGFKEDKWALVTESKDPEYELDNPRLFGNQFLITQRADSTLLFYHPDSVPIFLENELPELVRNTGSLSGEGETEFVLLETGRRKKLLNNKGNVLDLPRKYESFEMQGEEYIVFVSRGRKGLLGSDGKELLRAAYDGIGNYANGSVALLSDGKFGLFDNYRQIKISPEYDLAPEPLGSKYFKAKKEGLFGLIDKDEEELLDFEYNDLMEWNDSLVWAKKDFRWELKKIGSDEVVLEDVKDFKELDSEGEKLYQVLTGKGYGVISSVRGEIVPPTYSDLFYFDNDKKYTFFCEKNIEEAQFYVVIYVDHEGNIIRKQAFEEQDYERIYCDL